MISSASGLAGTSEPCACANEAVSQMPDSLTISLKGDSVGLGDLTEALGDFTAVLGEVERDVTGRRDIEWKLAALEHASAALYPQVRLDKGNDESFSIQPLTICLAMTAYTRPGVSAGPVPANA